MQDQRKMHWVSMKLISPHFLSHKLNTTASIYQYPNYVQLNLHQGVLVQVCSPLQAAEWKSTPRLCYNWRVLRCLHRSAGWWRSLRHLIRKWAFIQDGPGSGTGDISISSFQTQIFNSHVRMCWFVTELNCRDLGSNNRLDSIFLVQILLKSNYTQLI